jgi:hypothetical protein
MCLEDADVHRWQDVESALERWREAERRAARLRPSTAERLAAERDVAMWRATYQLLVSGGEPDGEEAGGGDPANVRPAVLQAGRR